MLAFLMMIVVAAGAAPAAAGVEADVTRAFAAFVDGVAAGKPLPASLEVFVVPDHRGEPLPDDLGPVRAMLVAPKLKVLQVMASASGRSAWIAAEIPVRAAVEGKKARADVLRASAFLAFDGAAWTVRAAHWSLAVKNVVPEMCGDTGAPWSVADVPAALIPAVTQVLQVLDEDKPASFVRIMSDDKRALVFGSAPKETFVGGAKIKGVFKKWSVALPGWDREDPALPASAGVGPDGELAWMATRVTYFKLCDNYRALLVMAKEKGAWKLVHQHYSEEVWFK